MQSKDLARRNLRVLIVTENFLPKVDGVTRCLARLLKHLRDEGHEAIVLGPEVNMSSYETHPVIGTAGIPLILYPGLKLNFLRPKFLRTIMEFNPDVIHVVDPIWLGPQVLFALRRGWCGPKWSDPKAPIVGSFHTNLPTYASLFGLKFMEAFMWSWIENSHSQCRLTACPTLSTATMLMQKGIRNTRIWPRGVDLAMFGPDKRCHAIREIWGASFVCRSTRQPDPKRYPLTPPPSPDPLEDYEFQPWKERCVILYAGRLSYEKNLLFLIESFRILLASLDGSSLLPVFVFAGDGPARPTLEENCRSKNIPAIFMGHLSGEHLAKCYASADIFAFPSYTETFGQVVLEALASGLPVVGLDADGTRDLVQHERTGLLLQHRPNRLYATETHWPEQFDPGSPRFQLLSQQYAVLLRRLVTNTTLRGVMSECASTCAPVGKSWDDAMACMVGCYREVIPLARYPVKGDLDQPQEAGLWGYISRGLFVLSFFLFIFYSLSRL